MVMAFGVTNRKLNSDKSLSVFRKEKVEILLVDFLSLDQATGFHKPIVFGKIFTL